MNKRKTGAEYEQRALAYMVERGFVPAQLNFRVRQGEIDIVGYDGEILVFAEVKYRRGKGMLRALESVGYRKQAQISRISLFYLNQYRLGTQRAIRYDVVAIDDEGIRWVKNAFPYRA